MEDRKLYVLKASKDDAFLTSSPNYFGPLYEDLLERSKVSVEHPLPMVKPPKRVGNRSKKRRW